MLEGSGLLHVERDPGASSYYLPHAKGPSVRVPQHLWRPEVWFKRDRHDKLALDGASLWTLLMLVTYANVGSPERGAPDKVRSVWRHRIEAYDATIFNWLGLSQRKISEALHNLERLNLITTVETRGKVFLIPLEPVRPLLTRR
jgi:hypothetical protein